MQTESLGITEKSRQRGKRQVLNSIEKQSIFGHNKYFHSHNNKNTKL